MTYSEPERRVSVVSTPGVSGSRSLEMLTCATGPVRC